MILKMMIILHTLIIFIFIALFLAVLIHDSSTVSMKKRDELFNQENFPFLESTNLSFPTENFSYEKDPNFKFSIENLHKRKLLNENGNENDGKNGIHHSHNDDEHDDYDNHNIDRLHNNDNSNNNENDIHKNNNNDNNNDDNHNINKNKNENNLINHHHHGDDGIANLADKDDVSNFGIILDVDSCTHIVKAWHANQMNEMKSEMNKYDYENNNSMINDDSSLLFFLHVPRTGGRTYFSCFLRSLFPSRKHCPRSYDTLRLNFEKPNCNLFTSHDDYSVVQKLSKSKNSENLQSIFVISNIRNPKDRILSSYEFMVENAARKFSKVKNFFSDRTKKVFQDPVQKRKNFKANLNPAQRKRKQGVQTRNVWPWSVVLPMMEDDMLDRRNNSLNEVKNDDYDDDNSNNISNSNDSYNLPHIVMPLKEFIHHEKVKNVLHNGATFQIAGVTSNSLFNESKMIKQCVDKFPQLEKYVFDIAKTRLSYMFNVGLSDFHVKNMYILAKMMNKNLSSPTYPIRHKSNEVENNSLNRNRKEWNAERNEILRKYKIEEEDSSEEVAKMDKIQKRLRNRQQRRHSQRNILQKNENEMENERETEKETEKEETFSSSSPPPPPPPPVSLFLYYVNCVNRNREMYKKKTNFLHQTIPEINFTKQGRMNISTSILNEIMQLNSMDYKLYEYAKLIYKKQLEYFFNEKPEMEINFNLKDFDLVEEKNNDNKNYNSYNIKSNHNNNKNDNNNNNDKKNNNSNAFLNDILNAEKEIEETVNRKMEKSKSMRMFDSMPIFFLISLILFFIGIVLYAFYDFESHGLRQSIKKVNKVNSLLVRNSNNHRKSRERQD